MKILVLGCGLMGPVIARECCENEDVVKVVGCDIIEEQLKTCSQFVSHEKFKSSRLNLTDHAALVKRIHGSDVVVNASAARFSLDVVKAAMEAQVDVVDLSSASYPLEGDFYREVEKAGITVIPGCGVDPGLADILAGHGMDLLDEVEEVYFACGGLPRNPQPPLNYKIVFGGKKMPIRPGKVPVILEGNLVEVERYTAVEPIQIEGFEEMETFYDGYPSFLLNLCMERGVRTFEGKTIRYKGFADVVMRFSKLGILSEKPVVYGGQEIVPLNFFHELIYPLVKFDARAGDRDLTVLLVMVEGKKGDARMCIAYEMLDYYDEEKGITSMARTTGYTAAFTALMLGRGDISKKGIQWPVCIMKGNLFRELMNNLKKKGIEITEKILKTTTV